jgi:hypothetical protein
MSICKIQRKRSAVNKSVVNTAPGIVFATFHFLHNLQIGPVGLFFLHCARLEKPAMDKHSSSLCKFVSYKEIEVL